MAEQIISLANKLRADAGMLALQSNSQLADVATLQLGQFESAGGSCSIGTSLADRLKTAKAPPGPAEELLLRSPDIDRAVAHAR